MGNSESLHTDEELAHLALTHTWSFAILIDRYETKLRRYLDRLGRMPVEDVEDLLQQVFMKAYQNLNEFDPSLKFSSWIYRIAHNEAVSFFRRNDVRPEGHRVELSDQLLETMASELNVLKSAESEDARRLLAEKIGQLDNIYREVIILKFFEDKSYDEISNILMIPSGTVAIRLKRAKDKLETLMKSEGYIHES
ncbi:MAG: sigma-70 family RNA polymerase sigma factor [Patescibacteria group bacterium]